MKLKVIGSNSKGNSYVLENKNEILLIECGVKFLEIKKAIDFKVGKIVGCIISHEHKDHCKDYKEIISSGINLYATKGTIDTFEKHHRIKEIQVHKPFNVGGFKILPFDVRHNANEPCGFLINHIETGNILFLTDTYYCPYTFKNLNNIIIEANYREETLQSRLENGSLLGVARHRIMENHMSLENCIVHLKANNIKQVNNIVLIHLSDMNSDEVYFLNEVKKATQKNVTIAKTGVNIDLNKNPF